MDPEETERHVVKDRTGVFATIDEMRESVSGIVVTA